MVALSPLISFTTIYVFLGVLGSIASIWGLAYSLKRKKNKSARPLVPENGSGYERGFTVTFRAFKRHR